jgi:hypothetical protein
VCGAADDRIRAGTIRLSDFQEGVDAASLHSLPSVRRGEYLPESGDEDIGSSEYACSSEQAPRAPAGGAGGVGKGRDGDGDEQFDGELRAIRSSVGRAAVQEAGEGEPCCELERCRDLDR